MDKQQETKSTNIISSPSVSSNISSKEATVLDWAKYYVFKLGFSVILIQYKGKKPAVGSWAEFQKRKPTLEELEAWFSNGNRNIGIITGSISGITVVDADNEGGIQHCESNGLADAPKVKTCKGFHYYCQYVDGVGNGQDILNDETKIIDVRSEGGYIIAPPSVHESGVQYEWEGN